MLRVNLSRHGTSALLAFGLLGCTFTPRDAEVASAAKEDDKFARMSALEGHKKVDDDGFTLPRARGLYEDAPTPTRPQAATDTRSPSFRLGLATLNLGEHPPWRSPDSLDQPPELRPPADGKSTSTPAPTSWTPVRTIWVGEGYLYQAQFTPDGKGVVALSTDSGTLYHYELSTGKLLSKHALPDYKQFDDAAFVIMQELPDRPQAVLSRPQGAQVLDLESGRFDSLELLPAGNDIRHSGRYGLYGTSHRMIAPQSGSLRLMWLDGEVAADLLCEHRPDDWSLSRDGKLLALQYYPANTVELLDLENKKLLLSQPAPKWGGSVALSPDSSLIALGGDSLRIIRAKDGSLVAEDTDFDNNIDDIRFTPDGALLLVSAYDGKARSYVLPSDLSTLSKLPKPQSLPHSGSANVYQLGLSADGRMLVTPSGDKTIKIWKR